VTGGTGFVGANIARELVAAGATVRVLARPRADRRALEGVRVEFVDGDLLDPVSVGRAVAGVQTVYHVAADYRLWAPDPAVIYRTNVDGTRTVLEAAGDAGVARVVHTSSVGRSAFRRRHARHGGHAGHARQDGRALQALEVLSEALALDFARRGLPVVVVNPSAPVGPWDIKPTPTGQMIVDFMRGRMVATLDTGLNVVHVRDVAQGHLLAAERGKPGERYILGHAAGNLSLAGIFALLAEITGRPATRFRVPYALAWYSAAACEGLSRLTRRPPAVALTAVRMARKRMYFSPAKAIRDLGLPQTDPIIALREPSRGSRPTTWSPPAYEPRQPERQSDPQEPIQLLLRVSLAPARPARGALRGLRVLPPRRRRRRRRRQRHRSAGAARRVAPRARRGLRRPARATASGRA
jgi:dihydroflavonol-4-reductase